MGINDEPKRITQKKKTEVKTKTNNALSRLVGFDASYCCTYEALFVLYSDFCFFRQHLLDVC